MRRTYWSTATVRVSAPRSSPAATMPAEPPAIMPSVAVGVSRRPPRASTSPAATLRTSVSRVMAMSGTMFQPSAVRADRVK